MITKLSFSSITASALAAAITVTAPAQAQNLLTNGSFEALIVTAADQCQGGPWCVRSFASTPGWTQLGDGVDLINNNYTQPTGFDVLVSASNGINYLDMNQAGSLGGVFQTVIATPGLTYDLSLDTSAWALNSIGGVLGYELYDPTTSNILASGSFTNATGGVWTTRTLSAIATSNSIGVRIQALFSAQAGPGLDNVILTASQVNAVPEPATWGMMIVGFALVGSTLRRRNARSASLA